MDRSDNILGVDEPECVGVLTMNELKSRQPSRLETSSGRLVVFKPPDPKELMELGFSRQRTRSCVYHFRVKNPEDPSIQVRMPFDLRVCCQKLDIRMTPRVHRVLSLSGVVCRVIDTKDLVAIYGVVCVLYTGAFACREWSIVCSFSEDSRQEVFLKLCVEVLIDES